MAYDILKYEFKDGLNKYLASTSSKQVSSRNLKELIAFNEKYANIEQALFDQSIFVESQQMGMLTDESYVEALKVVQDTTRKNGIDKLLKEYDVAVLVAPSGPVVPRVDPVNGDIWPNDWPGFGSMAARSGYPHITVPMGGIKNLSVGFSFIGGKNEDANILSYAYAYEQKSKRRLEPQYLKNAEDVPSISKAMKPYK